MRRGGFVVDARPDSSRAPRIVASGRIRTTLVQTADADERDREADAAVERIVQLGLFRRVERGRIWHVNTMGDLAALDGYVRDSCRFDHYERGGRARLIPFRDGPLILRRAIKLEVLERL